MGTTICEHPVYLCTHVCVVGWEHASKDETEDMRFFTRRMTAASLLSITGSCCVGPEQNPLSGS
jgi:hypothetical protein